MNPKLLFVNPYIHDFAAYDLWMKPLGLYWIAGYLKNHGFEIEMIDCVERYHPAWLERQGIKRPKGNHYGCGHIPFTVIPKPSLYAGMKRYYRRFGMPVDLFKKLLRQIERPDAILVGSMMTYWYPGVFETISLVKEAFPDVPLALGGVYATLCPDHARKFSGADLVVEGPGEVKALKWLDDLLGTVREYPEEEILPVDRLPMPAHHFLPLHSPAVIATSLGCPLHCTYCASRILQPTLRQRPLSKVMEEIVHLVHKRHVHHIAFYDDALLVNAENHIVPILKEVAKRALQVSFHTPNGIHASLMTPLLAESFLAASVQTIRFSYERRPVFSPDQAPCVEDKELRKAIECLNEAAAKHKGRCRTEVYVKTGLPGQSDEEIAEAFAFVHRLGAHIKIADYSPVPGTPDFDKTMSMYGIDGKEPLYHNNTALQHFTGHPDPSLLQEMKALAGTLNFALDRNINLSDGSKLCRLFLEGAKRVIV